MNGLIDKKKLVEEVASGKPYRVRLKEVELIVEATIKAIEKETGVALVK